LPFDSESFFPFFLSLFGSSYPCEDVLSAPIQLMEFGRSICLLSSLLNQGILSRCVGFHGEPLFREDPPFCGSLVRRSFFPFSGLHVSDIRHLLPHAVYHAGWFYLSNCPWAPPSVEIRSRPVGFCIDFILEADNFCERAFSKVERPFSFDGSFPLIICSSLVEFFLSPQRLLDVFFFYV